MRKNRELSRSSRPDGLARLRSISVLAVLLFATPAFAEVPGVYEVKFEDVQTNCNSPLRYTPTKLTIVIKGNSLTVDIDRTPLMVGIPSKTGAINAKSKAGNTMIDGMKGVFSVSGKVTPEGLLALVMIGEYTNKETGKPLCSQSWNVSGPKTEKPKKSSTVPYGAIHPRERDPVVRDFVHLTRFGW